MPQASELLPRLRERLLLDWDDPFLRGPLFVSETGVARKKLSELASSKGEDAVTWSVFRVFSRLPPAVWLSLLLSRCSHPPRGPFEPLQVNFWREMEPARSRLLWLLDHLDALEFHDVRQREAAAQRVQRVREDRDRWRETLLGRSAPKGDGVFEAHLEVDVVLETPGLAVVVEGKLGKDIETRTPWDPHRDIIARCLDAALDLAGPQRDPYFVLVTDDYVHTGPYVEPMSYESLLPRYRDDAGFLAARLPHRTEDERARLQPGIAWLSWADLVDTALDRSAGFAQEQKALLRDLVEYLKPRKLLYKGG